MSPNAIRAEPACQAFSTVDVSPTRWRLHLSCVTVARDMIFQLIRRSKKGRIHGGPCASRSAGAANHWARLELLGRGLIVAAFVMLVGAGCESPKQTPFPTQTTPKTKVVLAAGDVIRLSFSGAPDLNQSQKIRADGKVSLPMIGEVTASGKTLIDFQNELIRLYKPQLRDSEVVVVLESGVTQVVISGAVTRPGKFIFDRPTTLLQAIMEAGGASDYGSLRKVQVIRVVNGSELTQVLDLKPTLSGRVTSPFYVRDGDVVYVPSSAF